MSFFSELAWGRRSIRKFEDKDIPIGDIEDIIRTATSAPSGCNSQCWSFVAIKEKHIMDKLAEAVVTRIEELIKNNVEDIPEQYLASKRKMVTFFTKAPVVIAVFMTKLEYYDPLVITALRNSDKTDEEIMKVFAYPDLLSIGAAVQNLLLAAHEKGYGACWMNEPAIAGDEINRILNVPVQNKFVSLIPIGVPAYSPREKKIKNFDEVFKSL